MDHRILLPNGEIKTVNEQAEVLLDENGNPVRLLGTVLDITERKRAENLGRAFSKLGQQLSSATTAVEAARIIADEGGQTFWLGRVQSAALFARFANLQLGLQHGLD